MDLGKGPAYPRSFKGYGATMTLYADCVEIKRNLAAKLGGNKDCVVPLADVVKLFSKDPTRLLNGYVFLATDADPGKLTVWADTTVKQVGGNPHAVLFTWNQRETQAQCLAAVDQAWRAIQSRM